MTPLRFRALAAVAVLLCGVWIAPAQADEITARATVGQSRIPVNSVTQLQITVTGTQQAEAPDVSLDGFDVRYLGPSTSVSIVNGVVSSSVTHVYTLLPQREGTFTLGPLDIRAGGRTVQTQPITIEVVPASAAPASDSDDDRQPEGRPQLRLELAVDKTRASVNEAIPARVQLLIGQARVRDIELPALTADGFLVKPFGQPTQSSVVIDGESWTLLEFDTTLVPIRSGTLTLGPARLQCQVSLRRPPRHRAVGPLGEDPFEEFFGRNALLDDFFGTLDPVAVTANSMTIEVLPLPDEGKPPEFTGAVGRFTFDVQAVPTDVAAGEPVTLTMTVSGQGNFDTVAAPRVPVDPQRLKPYEPKARPADQGHTKVFEQVLIPLDPSVQEIPAIRFSFFDPSTGRYETVAKGPIPLHVRPASVQEPSRVLQPAPPVGARSSEEPVGRDILYIKEALGPLRRQSAPWPADPRWLVLLLTPILIIGASEAGYRRRLRRTQDPGAARLSGALRRALARCASANRLQHGGQSAAGYTEIFRAIQGYVGDRFNLPSEGLTRVELERHLAARGVPAELITELVHLAERCDTARFAPASQIASAEQMAATVQQTEAVLKRLDRWKPA